MFTTNVNELCASEEMSAAAPSIGVTLFSTFVPCMKSEVLFIADC